MSEMKIGGFTRMKGKPTVVLDGTRVEIDGEEWLVLVLHRDYPVPG